MTATMNASPVDLAPPLLPTEQIGPKGWIRNMLFFKLADDYDIDSLTTLLQTSFRSFKNRTPVAGCEAIPLAGKQGGLVQLRQYGDEIEDFVVKDLRDSFASYAELEARGFPASALKPETLCLRGDGGEWPQAGDRINVLMVQANFIRGGLILNMLVFHAYADGTTAYKFTEILGEEVRRAQNLPITNPVEIPWEDRAKLMQASPAHASPADASANLGSLEQHPEYTELPFTPQGVPPNLTQAGHVGHVFYFSPEKIKILKALAAPSNAHRFMDPVVTHVSTNDVLTALMWRCVLGAQHPSGDSEAEAEAEAAGSGPCILGVAVDGRRRAGVPIHKHTIGNIIGFAPVILDLATVKRSTIADLAISIHRSIAKTGAPYIDSLTTMVHQAGDVSRLTPTMFLDMPGRHMLMSSWAEFPFYDIPWGPALGHRIQSVRVPASGVCHAFHIRLPDHPQKGGVEVFVGAMSPAMDRLLVDPLWNEFAESPAMSRK